jgi:hypothetical protein
LKIEHLERGFIIQLVVPNMTVNGRKINSMVMENRYGRMKQFIKENIKTEKNMAKVLSFGKMTVVMMDSSFRIIFMGSENMCGKMEEFIKEIGKTIKWKVKEFLLGLMAGNMKGSTRMIKRKVLGYLPTETVEPIRENGRMESSMVKESSARKT